MRAKWGEDLTLGRVTRYDYNKAMREGGMIDADRTDVEIQKELDNEQDESIPITDGE